MCLVFRKARLSAFKPKSPARAQDTIRIRFAHSLSTTEPAHLAAEYFAKNVAQRTGNKVQIQLFPSEQLGPGKEVNEMIRQGANVMNITDPGYLSDFVPDIGVLNGPYLIKDPKDYAKLLASDWYKATDGLWYPSQPPPPAVGPAVTFTAVRRRPLWP